MALSDAEQGELLKRVRDISAVLDWYLVPDDNPNTAADERQPSSKGEFGKRIRSIDIALPIVLARLSEQQPGAAISAADIAAAIPAGIAQQVVDELRSRL